MTKREELLPGLAMLDASSSALRRDECGDYCIQGSRGHVYPWGDGKTWWVMVRCRSARHWTYTKARLRPFVEITQDGDEEGAGRMGSIDTEQAAVIREICGIRKSYSPEELERRSLTATGFARQDARIRVG
jgi:hypothetical protein